MAAKRPARRPPSPEQPTVVRATRITSGGFRGATQPGSRVSSKRVTVRVFADARHGFALYGNRDGQTLPAATTDGGRVWRVVGPVLTAEVAQGALVVNRIGIAGPHTYFAYGDGSVVDVSPDGGKHWWRAALGDEVPAVIATGEQLIAFAQRQPPQAHETLHALVWVYDSTDWGRVWRAYSLLAPP